VKSKIVSILLTLAFLGLMAVMFTACVVPRNYPRAKWKVDKIVDKWPEVLENDTTVLTDTTFVPEVAVDTLFKLRKNDTVTIYKDRLKVRVIRGKRDTIQLEAECQSDTIIKKIPVPVYTVEEKNLRGGFPWYWVLIGIIILLAGYIGFKAWRKKYK